MSENDRSKNALTLLRILSAGLIAAHGWHRLINGDAPDLGGAITDMGFPAGLALGWIITIAEAFGAPLLALGRFAFPLSAFFTFIYTMSTIFYHAPHGWYTSGSNKDGCEYPVLLVGVLLCVCMQYAPSWSELRARGLRAFA
jgi:putative oxidoreductase